MDRGLDLHLGPATDVTLQMFCLQVHAAAPVKGSKVRPLTTLTIHV